MHAQALNSRYGGTVCTASKLLRPVQALARDGRSLSFPSQAWTELQNFEIIRSGNFLSPSSSSSVYTYVRVYIWGEGEIVAVFIVRRNHTEA